MSYIVNSAGKKIFINGGFLSNLRSITIPDQWILESGYWIDIPNVWIDACTWNDVSTSTPIIYTDNFNSYPSYIYLADTSLWDLEMGSKGLGIYSNSVCPSVAASDHSDFYNQLASNDQFSQILVTNVTTAYYIGPSVRNSGLGTGNFYGWYGSDVDSYLFSYNNNVAEFYATGGPWAAGQTRKLEVVGNELRCYLNGTLDSSIAGDGKYTDINNRHVSGYVGLCGYNSFNINARLNAWTGGDVSSAYPYLNSGVISGDQTIDYGGDPTVFNSVTLASGGFGTLTYTWQYSTTSPTPGSGSWTDIGSSNSSTYNSGVLTQTTYFTRKVMDQIPQTSYTNAVTVTVNASVGPVTSNQPFLSHNQYYSTYDGALNNDIVGVWNPWYVLQDTCTGTFSHSIINNVNNIYALDASGSNGILRINNNASLTAGTDVLTIRTTFGGLTQDCSAYIKVMTAANSYFIDPTAGAGGSGTRGNPFNTMPSFTSASGGKAFFLRRGTTYTTPIVCPSVARGSAGNETVFGSYGTGARPILNTNGNNEGLSLGQYSSGGAHQECPSYVNVYELYFTNCKQGLRAYGSEEGHHLLIVNCEFNNTALESGGQLYISFYGWFKQYPNKNNYIGDIITHSAITGTLDKYGIKIENAGNWLENIRTYDNKDQGISCAGEANYNTFRGISAYGNQLKCMELSGFGNIIEYSYLAAKVGNGTANYNVLIDDESSASSIIRKSTILGAPYYATIYISAENPLANGDPNAPFPDSSKGPFIIEDCDIYGQNNTFGGQLLKLSSVVNSVIIRRNRIHDCVNNGITLGKGGSSLHDVSIYDNIFYNNTNADIMGVDGTAIRVYNNTGDGAINLTGTTNEVVVNNFYKSLTGEASSHHNIDIDNITVTDYFVNNSGHNYHLKSTATNAIGKGTNIGITIDYDSSTFTNPPSIGSFEYFADKG
jgi:hypothetical protein